MIIGFEACSKCNAMCVSEELTVCVHYDNGEILGKLCDICVAEWLKHLDTLDEAVDE